MNALVKEESSSNIFLKVFACALPLFVFASKVSADAIFSLTCCVFLFYIFVYIHSFYFYDLFDIISYIPFNHYNFELN